MFSVFFELSVKYTKKLNLPKSNQQNPKKQVF